MPDDHGPASVFIWYHADASLACELQTWVGSVGRELGIPSRLLIRRQPDRTTFMEIYEPAPAASGAVPALVGNIQALAERQPWFALLPGPRRAEVFTALP